MKEQLRKILNVIIFFGIWIVLPMYLAERADNMGFYLLMLFTWFPALFIVLYLNESEE